MEQVEVGEHFGSINLQIEKYFDEADRRKTVVDVQFVVGGVALQKDLNFLGSGLWC